MCVCVCRSRGQILGLQVDPTWLNVSRNIYVPFNSTGNFHPEYVGYKYGQVVKQVPSSLRLTTLPPPLATLSADCWRHVRVRVCVDRRTRS
jgi:hypothetical protein